MADFIVFLGQQWILVGLLLIFVFRFIQLEARRGGDKISSHQLTAMINNDNAVVVDVRESAEYGEGHIVDAVNIPFNKMAERITELEKYREKPLIVVDKMGQHSGAVGKQLLEAGFNVVRLDGGMAEWKAASLPVVLDS
jgi:rhodanese-related sulfurtransferase